MKEIAREKISQKIVFCFLVVSCFLFASCSDTENEKAIQWKFQNFDKLTYNFTQKTEMSPMGGLFSAFGITNTATGKLTITPTSDNKADIVLKDLNMGQMGGLLTQNLKKEGGQLPDLFVRGLKPNGTIEGEISEAMQLFYTGILPIPTEDLQIGESIKISAQMPMNAFGSQIIMTGWQTLTLNAIEGSKYKFDNKLLINEYDIPEDVDQNHQHEINGEGEYIFDIEKGYFTNAEVKLKIKMKISDLQKEGNSNKGVIPDSIQNKLPFKMDLNNMEMNFASTVILKLIEDNK